MKEIFLKALPLSTLFVTQAVAISIMDTPHGHLLSSSNGSDNDEVCVFCHTPHGANVTANGPSPLWNKPTSTLTFQMYGASTGGVAGRTIAGTLTDAQPSDQTLACLGCHDGISAMNSVINAPGSGTVASAAVFGGAILIGQNTPAQMPMAQTKAVGAPNAVDVVNGTVVYGSFGSLNNDHPVSIPYIAGRAGLRNTNTFLTDFFGATTISDLLRDGKVQCVSCHDPHGTGKARMLRTDNSRSALCLGCHDK